MEGYSGERAEIVGSPALGIPVQVASRVRIQSVPGVVLPYPVLARRCRGARGVVRDQELACSERQAVFRIDGAPGEAYRPAPVRPRLTRGRMAQVFNRGADPASRRVAPGTAHAFGSAPVLFWELF